MADANMAAARVRGDALFIPKPRRRALNLSQVRRDRLEAIVEHLICLLDVWDGDDDREPHQDDDCCAAHDDDPEWSNGHGNWLPGDPDDAEPDDDLEASAQPPVTPDSTRPSAPPVWMRGVL